MTIQNYCMVNKDTNICDNVCIWDGNNSTWTPPSNYLMLIQSTTPSKTWQFNETLSDYVLTDGVGNGDIGFTWDGNFLTTNQPKPLPPVVE